MGGYVSQQDKENFGCDCFGDILMWIESNLQPDQVFDEDNLIEAVIDTCFEELRTLLNAEFTPDQIFDEEVLREWATNNPAET